MRDSFQHDAFGLILKMCNFEGDSWKWSRSDLSDITKDFEQWMKLCARLNGNEDLGDKDCGCSAWTITGFWNVALVLLLLKKFFHPKWLWHRIRWIWAWDLGNKGSNWVKSGRCKDFSRAGLTPPYCAWPACLFSRGSLDEEPWGQAQMWVTQRMEAAWGHHLRAAAQIVIADTQWLLKA